MRNKDADEKHGADVEDQNTPEDLADRTWNSFGRVVRFTRGDADHFSAGVESTCNYESVGDTINGIGERSSCFIFILANQFQGRE